MNKKLKQPIYTSPQAKVVEINAGQIICGSNEPITRDNQSW